jgi:putative solute:sodium symporter small subunit
LEFGEIESPVIGCAGRKRITSSATEGKDMSRRDWLCSVVGWDGCLPLLVAVAPTLLPVVLPNRVLAELTAFIAVPIVAALLRAHHGCRQLKERGYGTTLGRQLLFGCAIVALLLFEGLSGVLNFAAGAPLSMWFMAGGSYLAYLGLVVAALRPQDTIDAESVAPDDQGRITGSARHIGVADGSDRRA